MRNGGSEPPQKFLKARCLGWRWLVVVPRAVVVFNLVTNFMEATIRQFGFMLRGLEHGEEQHQAPPLLLQSMRFWCFSVVRVALGCPSGTLSVCRRDLRGDTAGCCRRHE